MHTLRLTTDHWQTMREHVDAQAPLEACGLLAGINDQVQAVLLIANQAQSPARFRMDPLEQLQAFEWMDAHGLDLVGIFHSHPAGPETASATDIAEAAYEVIHVIWSRPQGEWQARAFWIEDRRVDVAALKVVHSQ